MRFNFNTYKNIGVVGDIHGEFFPCIFDLYTSKKLSDAVIIVAGDIGIGFEKEGYYINTFNKINKRLEKYNIHICLVRGNHDNPEYFSSDSPLYEQWKYVHIIPDYSIIETGVGNILCVGGATSIDVEFRRPNVSWWQGENVSQIPDTEFNNINFVVTHCAPAFENCCPPFMNIRKDVEIRDNADRKLLSDLYINLDKNNTIKKWIHGHYHQHSEIIVPNKLSDNERDALRSYKISADEYTENDMKKIGTNYCTFIGLDMFDNKNDLYML